MSPGDAAAAGRSRTTQFRAGGRGPRGQRLHARSSRKILQPPTVDNERGCVEPGGGGGGRAGEWGRTSPPRTQFGKRQDREEEGRKREKGTQQATREEGTNRVRAADPLCHALFSPSFVQGEIESFTFAVSLTHLQWPLSSPSSPSSSSFPSLPSHSLQRMH